MNPLVNYNKDDVVNGWLIYKEDSCWVVDDECGNKYYCSSYEEAVENALKLN